MITSWITIPRSNVNLRCSTIVVSAPWGDKGGIMVIIRVKWNTVITIPSIKVINIPSIKYGFLLSLGDRSGLMKRGQGMVSSRVAWLLSGWKSMLLLGASHSSRHKWTGSPTGTGSKISNLASLSINSTLPMNKNWYRWMVGNWF